MPKDASIHKVLVIGSGPIVIGQAAEFDYAGAQACRVLREEGVEVVLVNSNPATIMTDRSSSRMMLSNCIRVRKSTITSGSTIALTWISTLPSRRPLLTAWVAASEYVPIPGILRSVPCTVDQPSPSPLITLPG